MIFKLDWTQLDNYNFKDLNRVESNIQAIADLLKEIAYAPELQTIKNDWNMMNFPTLTQINRIENNIDSLRQNFYTPSGWQDMKTWIANMKFNYLDAYRYENNLNLLFNLANTLIDNFVYCGTFYAGEEVIL